MELAGEFGIASAALSPDTSSLFSLPLGSLVREFTQPHKLLRTQPVEETWPHSAEATEETICLLIGMRFELAEEQVNQPKTAEAEKIMDEIDQKNAATQKKPESPYDIESEIKIIKWFQPRQPDDAQIMFLGAEPYHFDYDQTKSTMHVDYDSDFGLRSMPDDDLVSLTGFETPESDDNDSQEGTAETFNAPLNASYQNLLINSWRTATLRHKVSHLESALSNESD
ncbi:hypothetical protein Tco_0741938 [Tanacetum coccineum]